MRLHASLVTHLKRQRLFGCIVIQFEAGKQLGLIRKYKRKAESMHWSTCLKYENFIFLEHTSSCGQHQQKNNSSYLETKTKKLVYGLAYCCSQ